MIQFRDHHFIARPPLPADAPRGVKRDRGHVIAKDDFARRGVEQIGERFARLRQGGVGLGAGRIIPVRVGVVVKEIIRNGVGNRPGHLRSSRAVKISDRFSRVPPEQGGKAAANGVRGKRGVG